MLGASSTLASLAREASCKGTVASPPRMASSGAVTEEKEISLCVLYFFFLAPSPLIPSSNAKHHSNHLITRPITRLPA